MRALNVPQSLLTRTVEHVDTKTAAITTTVLWCIALAWYAYHTFLHTPHANVTVYDFGETMVLALACLAFQLSALRVGLDDLAHIWHATVDPTKQTEPDPARWRVFGWIGAASWVAALGIGLPILISVWHPDSTNLIFALVIVLIPAVQCTGAAVVGPLLTHAIQERETALEARLRIRAAAEAAIHPPRPARHHGLR
jgi:hypothetical protein